MPDFTKGKWEYFRNCEGNYSIAITGSKGQCIVIAEAFIEANDAEDIIPEARANARLIANTPEMYYELHNLLEYLYIIQSEGFMIQTQEDIDRVEALLARIDGEEAQI